MARMAELADALTGQDWPGVDRVCRWARLEFGDQGAWEERALFPLLEAAGAKPLAARLSADHRAMVALAHEILSSSENPGIQGERTRQLLDLVRQHLDAETHFALPLIQGHSPISAASRTDTGYQSRPAQSYPRA
jgi:hypothetical protein